MPYGMVRTNQKTSNTLYGIVRITPEKTSSRIFIVILHT